MRIRPIYIGKWRITSMEQWDMEFVDLIDKGHFSIRKDGTGTFQFGAVQGEMDCRITRFDGVDRTLFSWMGFDEDNEASGMGWVEITGKTMTGWIQIHQGDDSGFVAIKK
jgi:hypothetical protein